MSSDVRREDFEYWLADMDDAVEGFLDVVPPEVRRKLDFSPASLDELEAWILQRYASTNAMLEQSESRVVDGLARYIGGSLSQVRWGALGDTPGRSEVRFLREAAAGWVLDQLDTDVSPSPGHHCG